MCSTSRAAAAVTQSLALQMLIRLSSPLLRRVAPAPFVFGGAPLVILWLPVDGREDAIATTVLVMSFDEGKVLLVR